MLIVAINIPRRQNPVVFVKRIRRALEKSGNSCLRASAGRTYLALSPLLLTQHQVDALEKGTTLTEFFESEKRKVARRKK